MKPWLIFLFFMLPLSTLIAQDKKNNSTTKNQTDAPKPKRVPGTEGKDPHPEAKLNSALPLFTLIDANQKTWTNKNIPANHRVIFAMFNPGCGHCNDFGSLLTKLKDSLTQTTVILMTFQENFNDLQSYLSTTGLDQMLNVHAGIANNQFILNHFMPNYVIPQVMIYNKQKKLRKILYEKIEEADILAGLK